MSQALLEAKQLAQLIDNGDQKPLVVALLSAQDFANGHIPHSVAFEPSLLSSQQKPAAGQLPATESLVHALQDIGLPSDKACHIVAYDNAGGSLAGRFIWTLALFGYHNTALLDGGLKSWQRAQLSLSTGQLAVTPSSLELTLDSRFIADKSEVLASIPEQDSIIWDARSAEEYRGEKVLAARGGHIPGAISHDWLLLQDAQECLKPLEQIRAELAQKGIDANKQIITHCQTHRRSGLSWFVAYKLLGFDHVKAYPGSWSEWGNDATLPIEAP
ncbi:MAG: sulfurtransferase [Pseudomonadales bacterium]|nr:sulfurtransferase [Pseudomonadales bacterium]